MVKFFKNQVMEDMKKQQKEEADYNMSMGLMQGTPMDEQNMIEKRDVLVQLSQWQQDRSGAMQMLFLKLCGYEYDKDDKKLRNVAWDKGVTSLFGSQKLVNFIEPLDRNVMLANWRDQTLVTTLREGLAHPLRRFIFMNNKELGISIEKAEYVFWLIMNTVEPTYWRGWNDGERRKDKEIIKVQEIRNPYFQQKKKGVFGIETS